MTRKGSHKVKTGCFTCKKRKVKCDEAKPHCQRCIRTGRKCDGYSPPPLGSYSWTDLLGKQPILPVITARRNTQDGRALEYYHKVVAPAFSQFPVDDFWTRMVAQASLQEPAVRHAVVAISSIYELVDGTPFDRLLASQKGRYALVQYNQALQHLTKMRDESVVLFVCILFICIEALRENKEGALTHTRYGIKIFNDSQGGGSAWARDYFRPIFVRLTSCPFFFGATLDAIDSPIGALTEDISGPHESYDVCRYRIDLIVTRCIRFVREYELPLPGNVQKHVPDLEHFEERKERILNQLAEWQTNYEAFRSKYPHAPDNPGPYCLLEIMALVLKIWVMGCTEPTEMAYDGYLDMFQQIIDKAAQVIAAEKERIKAGKAPKARPKFVLEMGFIPTLYFVVIKCRDLKVRFTALHYMAALAPERENLWHNSLMYSVGKRVIEMEHGGVEGFVNEDGSISLPPDSARVKNATKLPVTPEKSFLKSEHRLAPVPVVPPSQMRVRDAYVLRDPDIRLGGIGPYMTPSVPHIGQAQQIKFTFGEAMNTTTSNQWVEVSPPFQSEGTTPSDSGTELGSVSLPLRSAPSGCGTLPECD